MGIPENIRALRLKAKLSQPELAMKAGVSQQLISQLENGKNLTTKYLPQIAAALGAELGDIDPAFAAVTADPVAQELVKIYSDLHDRPEWQQYLMDQARALVSRVRGSEAPAEPRRAKLK